MAPAYVALVGSVALWGLVFVAVHELLPVLGPVDIVAVRFVVGGGLFLTAIGVGLLRMPALDRRDVGLLAAAGVLAAPLSQLPLVEGQRHLSPPLAALIVATSPAATVGLLVAFGRETVAPVRVLGLAIALAGVACIVGLGAGSGANVEADHPMGAAIGLVTPVAWAGYTIVSAMLAARHSPLAVAGLAVAVGGLVLLPAMPSAVGHLPELDAGQALWLAFLILGGTLAPYVLWSVGLGALAPGRAAPFTYLIPVFAAFWSAAFLGVMPGVVTAVGGALVLTGVALSQHRRGK